MNMGVSGDTEDKELEAALVEDGNDISQYCIIQSFVIGNLFTYIFCVCLFELLVYIVREIENECRCMYSSRMTMCVPGSFIAESMKGKMILTFAARSRLNTTSVCIFCVVCVCMLCAKCGFSPSSDFLAQTLDHSSAQQIRGLRSSYCARV